MVGSGLKRRAYYVLALLLLAPVVVTGAFLMKGRDAKLTTSSSLLGRARRVAEHQLLWCRYYLAARHRSDHNIQLERLRWHDNNAFD